MSSLAFAGSGTIAVVHGLAATAAGTDVVAVAGRSVADATPLAEQLGAAAVDIADLPAGADIVVVAAPPALHATLTLAALEKGATVLVETPLASTLADADAIVDAARAAAGTASVVHAENLAFSPVVRASLALIDDLGPLTSLEARALSPRPTWGELGTPEWGGGCLFEIGVHPIALVLFAAGVDIGRDEVVSVHAVVDRGEGLEVEDHAVVHLRFRSGLDARIEVSWRAEDPVWDLQASSIDGVVRATLLPTASIERNGEPLPLLPAPPNMVDHIFQLGYTEQLREVLDVAAGAATAIDAEFGRNVLEIVFAACASASASAAGIPVELPYAGPRDLTPAQLLRWQIS